jgi:hypothetical protein
VIVINANNDVADLEGQRKVVVLLEFSVVFLHRLLLWVGVVVIVVQMHRS